MKLTTKQAVRKRQTEQLIRPLMESLKTIEAEIHNIRKRMVYCKCCGGLCFETRTGAKEFCCDSCRAEWGQEKRRIVT